MGAENRTFPRFAVEAAVDLVTEKGTVHRGTSKNLSRGGVCLEMKDAVAAGTHVTIRITLVFDKDRSSEPLGLPARVVWCTPISEAHQVGTQFTPLSPDQSTYLDMFLRYLDDAAEEEEDEGEDDPFAA